MTPLRSFVRDHLGAVEVVPGPARAGPSRLLRVTDADGREWYAKRLVRRQHWLAETNAYDVWGHLPQVPDVGARCARRQSMLLARLPGHRPRVRNRGAMREAGRVLRQLHDVPVPEEWASTWREQAAVGVDDRLAELTDRGVAVDADMVTRARDVLLASDLPEVATHGDYQLRNWRWHDGRLSVFDFGAAARRPAVWDLARLRVGACWGDPEGFHALVEGYGRALTPQEQAFLEALMPWRAMTAVGYGLRHGFPLLVENGLAVLEALAAGDAWGTSTAASSRGAAGGGRATATT